MSAVSTEDPGLQAAVRSCVQALRRVTASTLPPALDRYIQELGEQKEFLVPAEHAQLLVLVSFTEQRTLEKLQAELALRQLQRFFPEQISG
jgi:hypothetical protein